RPVLELADPHLDEQERHEPDSEPEEERHGAAPRGEVADEEDERKAEDRDAGRMHRQERVEPAEAGDALAAGVRPRGGRERARDDERERGAPEDERGAPELPGNELRRRRDGLERDEERRAEDEHREQQ